MTMDVKWNGVDIVIGDDNDAETVTGDELLEQSIGILVDDELDGVASNVITPQTVGDIEDALNRAIDRDVDIGEIDSLSVTEINRATDTVTVEAQVSQASDSSIVVEV